MRLDEIASKGLVGMVLTAGSGYMGTVAPYGGREKVFGTNPISWTIPRGDARQPIVLDIATSTIASSKVTFASEKGTTVRESALLDKDGIPTIDPRAFSNGGVLTPFGEYKGYGLNFMIEIMASLFAGFAPVCTSSFKIGNPILMMASSIADFIEPKQW